MKSRKLKRTEKRSKTSKDPASVAQFWNKEDNFERNVSLLLVKLGADVELQAALEHRPDMVTLLSQIEGYYDDREGI